MESLTPNNEQYFRENGIKKHAQEILDTLGLDMKDLNGKKVLDLGAGDAELGKTAKQEGIDIISIDRKTLEENKEGINHIVGDADNIPFQNESFDLIISHAAPPTLWVNSIDDVKNKIDEVKSLLKPGGEFRFGPLGIDTNIFSDKELFTAEEEEEFTTEQRVERVKEKSLEFLKSIDPSIEEDKNASGGFYTLKKGQVDRNEKVNFGPATASR